HLEVLPRHVHPDEVSSLAVRLKLRPDRLGGFACSGLVLERPQREELGLVRLHLEHARLAAPDLVALRPPAEVGVVFGRAHRIPSSTRRSSIACTATPST